jgi:predicted PhzF superfamily epimerase YddE/YHI9
MRIPIHHVDAFASQPFAGNPAAVCPLEEWLADALLQAIAAENNLSETAFVVRDDDGFEIRWFTPATEVDLCGHATLATAHVLFAAYPARQELRFSSRSGTLWARRDGDRIQLDFPVRAPKPIEPVPALEAALGASPRELLLSRDYLALFDTEAQVRALEPDMEALVALDVFGVMATARGDDCDFVSRFFAPAEGIPEDPVTGSSHCTLVPFWAARLGRTTLHARQVSDRGGELFCRLAGDRVRISGHAITYMEGAIELADGPKR